MASAYFNRLCLSDIWVWMFLCPLELKFTYLSFDTFKACKGSFSHLGEGSPSAFALETFRVLSLKVLFCSETIEFCKLDFLLKVLISTTLSSSSIFFFSFSFYKNCLLNSDLILWLTCWDLRIARFRFSYSSIKLLWRWLVTFAVLFLKTSKLVTFPPAAHWNLFFGSLYFAL